MQSYEQLPCRDKLIHARPYFSISLEWVEIKMQFWCLPQGFISIICFEAIKIINVQVGVFTELRYGIILILSPGDQPLETIFYHIASPNNEMGGMNEKII